MLDAIRSLIVWTPLGLPAFLFVITTVVFFHELGHFWVARRFGVKVEVFSVGFGGEIFGWTDRLGTRWKISWLPIGGYVKFAGDADAASRPDLAAAAAMTEEQRKGALLLKPLYQRAWVAAAGPIANFILAIVILTALYLQVGHTTITPLVGAVTPGGPASVAGIKPGDLITSIDGTAINDFQQLHETIPMSGGSTLALGIRRAGQDLTLSVTPRLMQTRDELGNSSNQMVIGILSDPKALVRHERYGPVTALTAACSQTWNIVRGTIMGVGQMLTGHASMDQLKGPVGIAKITRQVASVGFLALINLAAILSVSIGLVNLFPIPLLDGGHLLYYACEAVLGRPLSERIQEFGFRLGLILVLGLVLLTTWNDTPLRNLF
jgi:regulator of sigma E protease